MRCEAARAHLKALIDDELDRLMAWRVRRHLARCAACKEELAMIGRLQTLLLATDLVDRATLPTPRSLTHRARPRGAGLFERARSLAWVVGLVALAAALLARHSLRSTVAMAAAIRAFAGGEGWQTWHFTIRAPDGKITETWLRLPDAFREETRQDGLLTELKVQKGKDSWIYLPGQKRAYHARIAIANPAEYGDTLRELKRIEREAQAVGGLNVTQHPDRAADGRAVRVMDVEIDYAKHYGPFPNGKSPKTIRYQVTVDAQTGRLVTSVQNGYTTQTIAYDQSLPDALFTWKPPADVQVSQIGDWWAERLGHTLGTAQSGYQQSWDLTIHAVDVAANGDVWLTASWHFRDETMNTWGTTPFPMEITDDRGRTYVGFMGLGSDVPTRMVDGYTPREPRHPGEPFPSRISLVWPSTPRLNLPAPPPAAWTRPPVDPQAVAHPERSIADDERIREKARQQARPAIQSR